MEQFGMNKQSAIQNSITHQDGATFSNGAIVVGIDTTAAPAEHRKIAIKDKNQIQTFDETDLEDLITILQSARSSIEEFRSPIPKTDYIYGPDGDIYIRARVEDKNKPFDPPCES